MRHAVFLLIVYFKSSRPKAAKRFRSFYLFPVDTSLPKQRVFLPSWGFKNFFNCSLEYKYRVLISEQLLPTTLFSHYFAFLYNSFLMRNNCFSFAIIATFVKVKNNFSCSRQLIDEIAEMLVKPNQF